MGRKGLKIDLLEHFMLVFPVKIRKQLLRTL